MLSTSLSLANVSEWNPMPASWKLVEFVWSLCGVCVELAWSLRGVCVEFVWSLWGACVEIVWSLWEACVEFVWSLWGACVESVGSLCRVCVEFVWGGADTFIYSGKRVVVMWVSVESMWSLCRVWVRRSRYTHLLRKACGCDVSLCGVCVEIV